MPPETLSLHIVCRNLPGRRFDDAATADPRLREPVYLGIQKGREIVDAVPADRPHTFVAEFRVGRRRDGSPSLLGPFAQGPAAKRFVYLCWCECREGRLEMFRRAKIDLSHLRWRDLEDGRLEVVADMSAADGSPKCGFVARVEWQR